MITAWLGRSISPWQRLKQKTLVSWCEGLILPSGGASCSSLSEALSVLGLSFHTMINFWQRLLQEREKEAGLELRKSISPLFLLFPFPFIYSFIFSSSCPRFTPRSSFIIIALPMLFPWSNLESKVSQTWSTPWSWPPFFLRETTLFSPPRVLFTAWQ